MKTTKVKEQRYLLRLPDTVLEWRLERMTVVAKFLSSPLCSGELSLQVAVEMPFNIKTIESPTHKMKMKVSTYITTEATEEGTSPLFKVEKMSTVFG